AFGYVTADADGSASRLPGTIWRGVCSKAPARGRTAGNPSRPGTGSTLRYSPSPYGLHRILVDAVRLHAGNLRRSASHPERLALPPHAAHVADKRDLGDCRR